MARGGPVELVFWLVPALAAIVICRNPVSFADLGWQLQLGRLMAAQGPFLHETFVVTHLGEALLPNAWLAQMVYARVFAWAGLGGLRAVDALLWLSGPLVATIPARLRLTRPTSILYALVIGLAVALPSAAIRPQSFASLGFGLTLVLMHRVQSWRTALLWGLPLFVVWQNLHPSVPVAALIVGSIAAIRWAQYLAGRAERPVALTVLAMAAAVAVFATPAGTAIIAFARHNATASMAFGATEWFPLWNPYYRPVLLSVLASGALVLFVAVQQRKAVSLCDLVPVVITFAMALAAARFLMFYAIAIVPLLTRLDIGTTPASRAGLRRVLTGYAISAVLVVAVALLMPFKTKGGRELFAALSHSLHHGTVFCDPTLGGAIILDGTPDWTVSFDGRYYLYRPDEIALLHRAISGASMAKDIDRIYHPAAYALDLARNAPLVERLALHPETWRRTYDDGVSVLFVRISPPVYR
jgi:hypothetical protein